MKILTKGSGITAMIITIMVMTASHHQASTTPLLSAKPEAAVKFLYAAETYASKQIALYDSTHSVYVVCLTHPRSYNHQIVGFTHPCHTFLQAMMAYNHQSQAFPTLTLKQLRSQQVVKRLGPSLTQYETTVNSSDDITDTITPPIGGQPHHG